MFKHRITAATLLFVASLAYADDRATVDAFYAELLTTPQDLTAERMKEILSDDYVSMPTPPLGPGAQGMFDTVKYFGEAVPNLRWEPQEIIQHGNRFVIRSIAIGTPAGPFLGIEPATGRSFKIMSIDILTVKDGRVVHSYHVEDWTSAIAQLTVD
ncbi:MAG: ester cyclase [Pseudomonadota bacterium]